MSDGARPHPGARAPRVQGVTLPELCAECACILGKTVADVAAVLSLPEALLVIRQEQQRQMEWLRYHTQSRTLAAAAVWNKSAASALARFERALRDTDAPKATDSPKDLSRLYQQAGVPVKSAMPPKASP